MILKTLLPETENNLLTKQLDNQPTKTKGKKLQLILPEYFYLLLIIDFRISSVGF